MLGVVVAASTTGWPVVGVLVVGLDLFNYCLWWWGSRDVGGVVARRGWWRGGGGGGVACGGRGWWRGGGGVGGGVGWWRGGGGVGGGGVGGGRGVWWWWVCCTIKRKVQTLQTETKSLSALLTLLQRDVHGLTAENNELKLRLQTMEQQGYMQHYNSIELKGETYVVTAKDFTEIMRIEDDEEEIKMPWRGQNTPPPTQLKKDCKERTLTIFVKRFSVILFKCET
ncbi:hypothetical protein Tco_0201878 [Tanacetum coccineum]